MCVYVYMCVHRLCVYVCVHHVLYVCTWCVMWALSFITRPSQQVRQTSCFGYTATCSDMGTSTLAYSTASTQCMVRDSRGGGGCGCKCNCLTFWSCVTGKMPFKVVVVGAGVSGLMAARQLYNFGLDVTVVEARVCVLCVWGWVGGCGYVCGGVVCGCG